VAQTAQRTVTITNQRGLHARASAKFVAAVVALERCEVRVAKDGMEAAGSSILGLMMLGAARGDTIVITVTGPKAEAQADKLAGLVIDGFGED
jgi:phosphocarrier protein HPr